MTWDVTGPEAVPGLRNACELVALAVGKAIGTTSGVERATDGDLASALFLFAGALGLVADIKARGVIVGALESASIESGYARSEDVARTVGRRAASLVVAVAEERERCARICAEVASAYAGTGGGEIGACNAIESAIRRGDVPKCIAGSERLAPSTIEAVRLDYEACLARRAREEARK